MNIQRISDPVRQKKVSAVKLRSHDGRHLVVNADHGAQHFAAAERGAGWVPDVSLSQSCESEPRASVVHIHPKRAVHDSKDSTHELA